MKLKLALAALVLAAACSKPAAETAPTVPPAAAAAATAPTPADVRAMIEQQGATNAVKALYADGADTAGWNAVLEGVAGGDQAWLDLAPLLKPGTDAATAETLTIALSEALPKNAAGAMKLIGKDWTVDDVCRLGVIEPSEAEVAAWKTGATAAVTAVTDPTLADMKAKCLADIAK